MPSSAGFIARCRTEPGISLLPDIRGTWDTAHPAATWGSPPRLVASPIGTAQRQRMQGAGREPTPNQSRPLADGPLFPRISLKGAAPPSVQLVPRKDRRTEQEQCRQHSTRLGATCLSPEKYSPGKFVKSKSHARGLRHAGQGVSISVRQGTGTCGLEPPSANGATEWQD